MSVLMPFSISQAVLEASQGLAKDPAVTARLAWWARHAFSSERWLQFELAYRLDRLLSGRAVVGCERSWCDIVLYHTPAAPSSAFDPAKYDAAIELKWYANWWVKDGGEAFRNDIEKVSMYRLPALALCVSLIAWPNESAPNLVWIREVAERKTGVRTVDEMRAEFRMTIPQVPDLDEVFDCSPHPDFDTLSLWVLGYFNEPGRGMNVSADG